MLLFNSTQSRKNRGVRVGAALLSIALCLPVISAHGAFIQGGGRADVLIGRDDDNVGNPDIQIVTPPPNQSLDNADQIDGGRREDVLIGLQGNDDLRGGPDDDILIGGPENFDPDNVGNKDVIFGEDGRDINIWAPGDGSDAFIGGNGGGDTQVFGVIDVDDDGVPKLFRNLTRGRRAPRVPHADVTGSPGFCEIEKVTDSDFGYSHLVRFFLRESGNLAVTIRLKQVERVICTSKAGGEITIADLTKRGEPTFEVISLNDLKRLNGTLGEIVQ